ncbi:2-hydroxy-6-oxonona-2,4-dienedioate hydrolase [Paraburkholderia atlantica]|uniref:alpha/beta fold hydrolase n=1 Tax=Paraburkholderia atlantica TaxID=2654982 RepID=UPI003D200D37
MSAYTEQSTSQFCTVSDATTGLSYNVHYNDVGAKESYPVVMLHGSGPGASGWANYHRNIDAVVAAGYRVLLIDVPGFGKSDAYVNDKGSRADFNARIVRQVLDALSIEKAHLIGNSMGAHTCTALYLDSPQRVGKIVMMGGGTGGPSMFGPVPTEGIKLLNQVYREPTLDNVKRMMSIFVYDPSALTDDLLQMRVDAMVARKDHLENWTKSLAANPRQFHDFGSRLAEVKAPVMLMWGRDDRFLPFDTGLRLMANLPNAEMHLFGRCGHWVQWEHADKFNRMVLDFLAN